MLVYLDWMSGPNQSLRVKETVPNPVRLSRSLTSPPGVGLVRKGTWDSESTLTPKSVVGCSWEW